MARFWEVNLHLYTQQIRNSYSRVRKVNTTLKIAESFGKLLSFSCAIDISSAMLIYELIICRRYSIHRPYAILLQKGVQDDHTSRYRTRKRSGRNESRTSSRNCKQRWAHLTSPRYGPSMDAGRSFRRRKERQRTLRSPPPGRIL